MWASDKAQRRKSKVGELMGMYYEDPKSAAVATPTALPPQVGTNFGQRSPTELASEKAKAQKAVSTVQKEQDALRYRLFKLVTEEVDRGRIVDFIDDRIDSISIAKGHAESGLKFMDPVFLTASETKTGAMSLVNQMVKLQSVPSAVRDLISKDRVDEAVGVLKRISTGIPESAKQFRSVQAVLAEMRAIANELCEKLIDGIIADFNLFKKAILQIREIPALDNRTVIQRLLRLRNARMIAELDKGQTVEAVRELAEETSELLKWSWPDASDAIANGLTELMMREIPGWHFDRISSVEDFDSLMWQHEDLFSATTSPTYRQAFVKAMVLTVDPILRAVTAERIGQTASAVSAVCANRLVSLSSRPRAHESIHDSIQWFSAAVGQSLSNQALETFEWERMVVLWKLEKHMHSHSIPALHRLAAAEMVTDVDVAESAAAGGPKLWTSLESRFVQTVADEAQRTALPHVPALMKTRIEKLQHLTGVVSIDPGKRLVGQLSLTELSEAGSARTIAESVMKVRVGTESLLAGILWDIVRLTVLEDIIRDQVITEELRNNVFEMCAGLVSTFPYPGVIRIATRILAEADIRLSVIHS